jgi:integrase
VQPPAATDKDRIGPLVVLSATTGLRQGEALALRWEDVDLDSGTLTVRHIGRIPVAKLTAKDVAAMLDAIGDKSP